MRKRHYNPRRERASTAPYNFVPQPEKLLDSSALSARPVKNEDQLWERHDKLSLEGLVSGEIKLSATSLTPFFIRGPRKRHGSNWDTHDNRVRPEPFTDASGRAIIPGSSMRGMIRNLFEIFTFSKMSHVFPDKLFYRSMAADNIGQTYRNYMMKGGRKPEGGFFKRHGSSGTIKTCQVFELKHDEIGGFNYRCHPNYHPDWDYQHTQKTVSINGVERSGRLVLTGSIPKKKREFLFVDDPQPRTITIPESFLDRFEDDDQITQWQQNAFPVDKPVRGARKRKGLLADNEPVFFLTDSRLRSTENPDGLVFFGRARMFRLPYDLSPCEMVESPDIVDMTEAVFGKVSRGAGGKEKAIKGRVFFTDFVCQAPPAESIHDQPVLLKILSSPKPTTYQHYLVQKHDASDQLRTYLRNNPTTLRGHKLYWHRWDDNNGISDAVENDRRMLDQLLNGQGEDRQHTVARPVRENAKFKGTIRFTNLEPCELGALIAALDLPENCAHKIGMAKPLGLGSIRLTVDEVRLLDAGERYSSWLAEGFARADKAKLKAEFGEKIIRFAETGGESIQNGKTGLDKVFRLDVLYQILKWQGRPERIDTDYMGLDDFKVRKVLPTPHCVAGLQEPFVVKQIPLVKVDDETASAQTFTTIAPPPPKKPGADKLQINKPAIGKLELKEGVWIARFDNDERDGRIINPGKIPSDARSGQQGEFLVKTLKKTEGLGVRLEKLLD